MAEVIEIDRKKQKITPPTFPPGDSIPGMIGEIAELMEYQKRGCHPSILSLPLIRLEDHIKAYPVVERAELTFQRNSKGILYVVGRNERVLFGDNYAFEQNNKLYVSSPCFFQLYQIWDYIPLRKFSWA